MHSFEEIIANRKAQDAATKQGSQQATATAKPVQSSIDLLGSFLADKGLKMNNIGEIKDSLAANKPSLTIPIHLALPEIDIGTTNIGGLDDFFKAMITLLEKQHAESEALLKSVQASIENLEITITPPDIHIPEMKPPIVNVPAPIVKVEAPRALPTLKREKAPETIPPKVEAKLIEENYDYNAKGQLAAIVERYSDGSFHRVKGMDTGKLKHEYSS